MLPSVGRLVSLCASKCVSPRSSPPLVRHLSSPGTLIEPSLGLTRDEKTIQATAYQFALKHFRPSQRQCEEAGTSFPRETLRQAAQLGFTRLNTSAEPGGGSVTSRLAGSLIFEALAQGSVLTAAFLSSHQVSLSLLDKFGSVQLKGRFLPALATFEKAASYCLTEHNSGNDTASLLTTATKEENYYVVNGTKALISGESESEVYFILCRTGGADPSGISCLLVEKDTPGLTFGKVEQKLGSPSQSTRAVHLVDCKVPEGNLLGEEGSGFRYATYGLNTTRVNLASICTGVAQWALEETLRYCSERRPDNSRHLDKQNIQFKVASLAAELLACRLLVRAAARRLDEQESVDAWEHEGHCGERDDRTIPVESLAAASKLLATEKASTIIDGCIQLMGDAAGCQADYPLEQLLGDTRLLRMVEETTESMHRTIARDFLELHQNWQ